MRVYLSGAIEYAPDLGRGWRAELTPFLKSLGHEVYDPARDHRKNLTVEEASHFRAWKLTDPNRFQHTVRKIIDYDLERIASATDYIVCYWDQYAQRGAGTQGELTLAYRMRIPVYLIAAVPFAEISGWIIGCSSFICTSLDQLRQELPNRLQRAAARVGA